MVNHTFVVDPGGKSSNGEYGTGALHCASAPYLPLIDGPNEAGTDYGTTITSCAKKKMVSRTFAEEPHEASAVTVWLGCVIGLLALLFEATMCTAKCKHEGGPMTSSGQAATIPAPQDPGNQVATRRSGSASRAPDGG